jgi:hypothetical protein
LSTYLSGVPTAVADPRAFSFITASKGGSFARTAARWCVHLLVRLVIAVTCSSPAAAFDAAHLLHAADVMAAARSLARHPSARSQIEQPAGHDRLCLTRQVVAYRTNRGAFQPYETEEFGRQ